MSASAKSGDSSLCKRVMVLSFTQTALGCFIIPAIINFLDEKRYIALYIFVATGALGYDAIIKVLLAQAYIYTY